MLKWIYFLAVLFACFLVIGFNSECYAHGGGLDSNGGHKQTGGSYHYHNGGFSRPVRTYSYRQPRVAPSPRTTSRSRSRTTARVKIRKPRVKVRWESRDVDFKYTEIVDDGKCKVMLYVKVVCDRSTLVAVAKEIDEEHISFYLPGMNGAGEPWAIANYYPSKRKHTCSYRKQNLTSHEPFQIIGKVKRVTGGSDLIIEFDKSEWKIRLYGLTVPQRGEDRFQDARLHLNSICVGEEVVAYCREQATDGRLLAIVKLEDSFLNERMLFDGFAAVSDEIKEEGLRTKYTDIEAKAKDESKGLWAGGWSGQQSD